MATEERLAAVLDVAAYVLARKGPRTAMQLQKLVFYAQAWSLVWHGRPLFADPIEAWDQGPVVPTLFDSHRGQYVVVSLPRGDAARIDGNAADTIDAVLEQYGNAGGDELGLLTHAEQPWLTTRRNGVITLECMRAYYVREGLDAARAIGPLADRFYAQHLACAITAANRHPEAVWGPPVGREVL